MRGIGSKKRIPTVRGAILLAVCTAVGSTVNAQQVSTWDVAFVPSMAVGDSLDGNKRLDRVAGGAKLGDGTLVVASSRTAELHFFDSTGQHLRDVALGSTDAGAALRINGLHVLAGDTLLVAASWLESSGGRRTTRARVVYYDARGIPIRTFEIPAGSGMLYVYQLHTGGFLSRFAVARPPRTPGVARPASAVYLIDTRSQQIDSIGTFPTTEWVRAGNVGMGYPRGRNLHVAIDQAGRVFVGDGERPEILVLERGRDQRVIRLPEQPLGLSPTDSAAALDGLANLRSEGVDLKSLIRSTLPPHGSLHIDAEGMLWVERSRRHGDDQPIWWIMDPATGAHVANVRTPAGSEILEIGVNHLLVTRTSVNGPLVQVLRLRRS